MAKSLYSTVLHNYTYEEIRDLCFTEGSTFPNALDCNWDIWRDKAVADFDISPEFFDLVKGLSGSQRYLQISTYVKLSPLSSVRVYKDTGAIEGVYEARKGYQEALKRNDTEMATWFFNRWKAKGGISEREEGAYLKALKKAGRKEESIDRIEQILDSGDYTSVPLYEVIKTGRVDVLDKIIHQEFILPPRFSIERNVLRVPFWEISSWLPLDLPLQPDIHDYKVREFMEASIVSADGRIVDFFRSLFRDRDLQGLTRGRGDASEKSLFRHGKPEETYSISLRFADSEPRLLLTYMVEVTIYLSDRGEIKEDEYSYIVSTKAGDITFLQAFLPYLELEQVKNAYMGRFFPLSSSLLRDTEISLDQHLS